uniref:Uncharacterized protein n=1 Tax=Micrurus surinamensis TaxID=129470 RepID=A0A2D4PQY0_MICSU
MVIGDIIWSNIFKIVNEQQKIIKSMTSINISAKTGRKQISTTAIASPSTSTQRTIEGTLALEKMSTPMTNQVVQATLTTIQETMLALQKTMVKNHIESKGDREVMKVELKNEIGEMKTEIKNLEGKIGQIQESIRINEEKIKIIEEQAIQTGKKIEHLDQKIMGKDKETEEALNHLEMDKASYYLRFQNVEEDKEENLALVMAGIIAELLQREKNEIINELDDVYRVFTSYARQHRLPREH